MNEVTWKPRNTIVILKAILKPEVAKKKKAIKAKEVEVVDQDGNFYFDDYLTFIHDVGEDVTNDLGIGDQVFLSPHNLKEIADLTDRSKQETYFLAVDGVIMLRQPGKQII